LKTLKEILILAIVLVFFTVIAIRAQQASTQLPSYPIVIHDTGTSATVVKASPGTLHSLVINNPGASAVISIFDLAGASCTGTPSTNVKASSLYLHQVAYLALCSMTQPLRTEFAFRM
jgi:hypothetical protein